MDALHDSEILGDDCPENRTDRYSREYKPASLGQ
jgi:hypothetical protein